MSRTYFGTDGIRGTVGQPPITPDFMLRLGHAVGQVLRRETPKPVVLIGKDTRISGYMLESSLEAGFASAGVDVLLSGPLPTPGVAYLARALRLDLGVVISASHNPFGDNGVKFFSSRGEKLPDAWEMAVEAELERQPQWADSSTLGKARRLDDASGRYIEFCKSTVPHSLSLKGMTIVVDAAHGAAYHVAPDVFHELGATVVSIGCSPNGLNINDGFGATSPDALVAAVAEHRADYGIALDGDADRLQIVDAQGRLYNGDELLYEHVAIDEAQDRSALEVKVLIEAVRDPDNDPSKRSVTIAGDTAQRLVFDNNFSGWGDLLTQTGQPAIVRPLKLSYRSTAEVMMLAREILGPELAPDEPLAARPGEPVELHEFGDIGEAVAFLGDALRTLMAREPTASCCVISRHPEQADQYYEGLRRAEVPALRRIRRDEFNFQPGVDITDITQVKGLEFDYVVMVDVNKSSYPNVSWARHLLHIGVTRAAHQLWMVSTQDPSELVPRALLDGGRMLVE